MERPTEEIRGGGPRKGPIAALTALLCAAGALLLAPAAGANDFGPPGPGELPQNRLFDIGATDYDADGFLDLFSTNHKTRSAILRNDGAGNFTDQFGALGLSPTPAFPGYEYLRAPEMTSPAIYIWATDSSKEKLPGVLHIRSVGSEGSGTLVFESEQATVFRKENATVREGTTPAGNPTIDFEVGDGSVVDIRVNHIDLPTSVSISARSLIDLPLPLPGPPQAEVRVGALGVPASSRRFTLNLFDRHGFAFADLGGDAATDLFVVSGGLGGDIKLPGVAGRVKDELFISAGGAFTEQIAGSGLTKGTCRGRQVSAIDVDVDGLLDVFQGCEGDPPKVFMQREPGRFEEVPPPAKSVASVYRWVNLGGRKPELLAAQRSGVKVFRQTARGWRTVQRIPDANGKPDISHFSVSDYDSDGLLDVLAVGRSGNSLLHNVRGRLRAVPRERTGLPKGSLAASFVDYDNDGRVDLGLVPQGVYKAVGGGRFRRTGDLAIGKQAAAATTTWFDADNDGLRDPVIAFGSAEFAPRMSLTRRRNLGPGGHWLEVDLRGAAGNRQAIGARVEIRTSRGRQFQFVGQNDDSHKSQGHYRLYFGLGAARSVKTLAVRWPDGSRTKLRRVAADRLMKIAEEP